MGFIVELVLDLLEGVAECAIDSALAKRRENKARTPSVKHVRIK